jgi:TPR repeat protein
MKIKDFGNGCSNLGFMYDSRGKGVKRDDFKALKFYQKACDLSASKSSCLTPLPSLYESPRLEQPPPKFKSHAFW